MNERGRVSLLGQAWFLWPLALRLAAWAFLAHAYEMAVFQDVSWQMLAGQGVYARFSAWLAGAGDGYFAYPPLYAYMLWLSGWAAAALGGQWWLHQLLIKAWLVLADALVMVWLYRKNPAAARQYWMMWFVPVVAIGQVQPDLWAGLSVALALYAALRGRWWLTGALLALGAGLKVLPLIILPFLVIHLVQRRRWNALAHVGVTLTAVTTAVWLPYLALYGDVRFLVDVIRFQVERPPAGLTLISGVSMVLDAGRSAATLLIGTVVPGQGVLALGSAYLWITTAVFAGMIVAASRQRWPLARVYYLPLLVFLLANKVVHEHYLLQVLPLLLVLGFDTRKLAVAFGVYLLAAGSPLRFLPREFGFPPTLDALLPAGLQPTIGSAASIGLMIVSGAAAIAFSWQVFTLARGSGADPSLGRGAVGVATMTHDLYDAIWRVGVRIAAPLRRVGAPAFVFRLMERVATTMVPAVRREMCVICPGGLQLVIPPGLPSARTYALGEYEAGLTRLVRDLVRPGMTALDVGAFCGYYTVLLSRLTGQAGAVYAFEPYARAFAYILENVRLNMCTNVVATNAAVTDVPGPAVLALHQWPDHHWLADDRYTGPSASVQVIGLDDFFSHRTPPKVDFVKIDTEGSEGSVLRSMRRLCRESAGLDLVVELDLGNLRRAGTTWADMVAILRDLGFRSGRVVEQDMRPFSLSDTPPTSAICNLWLRLDQSAFDKLRRV